MMRVLLLKLGFLNCLAQNIKHFRSVISAIKNNDELFLDLKDQENWIQKRGFIPVGDDISKKELVSLEKAKEMCVGNMDCQAICFPRPGGFPLPEERISVDFKGKTDFHEHDDWWTLLKPVARGELKHPQAASQAVLYALRCARLVVRTVFMTMGSTNKQAQVNKTIDDVQRTFLAWLRNNDETEELKRSLVRAKSYLGNPYTQAYLQGDDKFPLGDTSNGIGLTFIPNSVDCDSKRTITLPRKVEMPRVGFGTWQLSGETAYTSVMMALKAGYRHIDTAQGYENEAEIGEAIHDFLAEASVKRSDLFISTKLSYRKDFGTGKTRAAFLKQLENLRLDYVDVYMLHGPQSQEENKEAWRDMEKLFEEGKIKALGVSNYDEWWLDDLLSYAKHRPVYLQNKFDIYTQGLQTPTGRSMLERAQKEGIAMAGYSTLNKWPFLLSPRRDAFVVMIAKQVSRTTSQVLLRWALQLGIAVLPRSSDEDHILENISIFDFELTNEQMHCLNRIYLLSNPHNVDFIKPFPVKVIQDLSHEEWQKYKREKDEL